MVLSLDIRTARPDDARAIHAIYAPLVENTIISFETDVPSIDEMEDRIRKTLMTHPYLVAVRQGQLAGYAYAGAHRTRSAYRLSVDVSAYVDEATRGKGVGKALYLALFDKLDQAGFHAAFAGIALPNPASEALHRCVGFVPVGIYKEVGFKFGTWHDVRWWQRLVAPKPVPQND
ncbi:MAG: arsinothricin resistance N-acetyltransferase ArsN1 family B [Pseudomonadota bacterium]